MKTAGFYKIDNQELLYAPNFVYSKNYSLDSENHADHEYPIDGWHWFENKEEAYNYFNIKMSEADELKTFPITPTKEPDNFISEWVQPADTLHAYQIGNYVIHDAKIWRCTITDNVWEPGIYGWQIET